MRCKKHLPDLSSSVGVCATCLRERLVALIAAQAQAQLRAQAQLAQDDRRKSDPHPPPLLFPRSVSPYVSRRKSDNAVSNHHVHQHHSLPDQRFYSTPQVGPTGAIVTAGSYKKKHNKFSRFFNLFRSKSEKFDLDHRVSDSNSADLASSSWFSSILSVRRKKQSRLFSLDESTAGGGPKPCRDRDRGMSPARYSNDGEDEECCNGSSGYASESPQRWKQTPIKATPQVRRGGGGRATHSRNVSGLAFCLSPLVRASPSRQWSQKGMQPEISFPGEIRVPVKPHLSTAAAFCANRSRKLADFGRFNQTH
ncbi:uncharacterized protein LOC132278248 [Cornus florida]|uniref:uncharacterized protein LOC132278248 n=1 Tax=Cornus florida TaxID=4283 RepID=UPI00289F59AB|nr:uncharacterized protein LOC132278248 [Cornus florida]